MGRDRGTGTPAIRAFGEAALLVELGGGIDPGANAAALGLARAIRDDPATGWGAPLPSYDSVLVPFDPDVVDEGAARARLERLARTALETAPSAAGRLHRIAVRYGGPDGPDLDAVAEGLGLTPAQVIEAHAAVTYHVFVLGFAPGFAYLGSLPDVLRLPRRPQPRPRVPAGSVAIAEAQTAIYPSATAGGWHLIGRTDVRAWDVRRDPPALLLPGDSVRFERVVP